MKTKKYDLFSESINISIQKIKNPLFSELNKFFEIEIASLYEKGILAFEDDYKLTGFPLECKVKKVFEDFGFSIRRGRDEMEDFVVEPPDNFKIKKPLVLEVKSSRKPNIQRDGLRQLDDWVFELSGEQHARKHGLPGKGGIDAMAIVSHGMLTKRSRPRYHPTPHKGVFIFNGPIGTPFNKRNKECLSPNDSDFVDKRDFCILPLDILINYLKKSITNPIMKETFWETIHNTSGILIES